MEQAENRDKAVAALALTSTPVVLPYRLLVRGKMHLGVGDAEPQAVGLVGDVNYANPQCEIFGAIQVGAWLFCVEKMSYLPDYYVGAFARGAHYTFGKLNEPEPSRTRQNMLLGFVATKIMPILQPELFAAATAPSEAADDDIVVNFAVHPVDEPYVLNEVAN